MATAALHILRVLLLLLLTFVHFSEQSTSALSSNGTFCYLDNSCGPKSSKWPGICQTGVHQSPINLPHTELTLLYSFLNPASLKFNKGYSMSEFYIRNNGHSIQVSFLPTLTSSAQMSGYGFDNPYIFAQAHFHWGENLAIGSEHTINDEHFPMEVHLVHYNSKYASFNDAAAATNDPKSLAVLAVFIAPVWELSFNKAFDTIASNVPINYQTDPVKISEPLDLSSLLPRFGQKFYRYSGSLTTPGCAEIVEWTVIPEPLAVKPSEFVKFRKAKDEDGALIARNFRPIQRLNGRSIEVHSRL